MLVLSRRVGDAIIIGHDIRISVLQVAGDKVRIGITAPKDLDVHREEVYLDIVRANQQAAQTPAGASASLAAVLPGRGRREGSPPGGPQPSADTSGTAAP